MLEIKNLRSNYPALPENQKVQAKKTSLSLENLSLISGEKLEISVIRDKKVFAESGTPVNGIKSPSITADESGNSEIRLFFFSDAHSRDNMLNKFIDIANAENPDLIIDGGDFAHDGTESEIKKAYREREKINAPVYMTNGNHDEHLRGPFGSPPPQIPPVQSFDAKGIHFLIIDNENEKISEEQFQQIEAALEANKGKKTIVSMHVPPFLDHQRLSTKISKILPFKLASTTMTDPKQVERFTSLMTKYKVSAVLAGHTHDPHEMEKDGVKYLVVSSTGGLTPGLGIDNEYLDISIKNGELEYKRVSIREGSRNPLKKMSDILDFYQDINSYNHQTQGWNYTPSVTLEYKAGGKISRTGHGKSVAAVVTASMGRNISDKSTLSIEPSVAAGPEEISGQISAAYKYSVIGDYNKGLYIGASAGVNGGMIASKASAGVGAKISTGIEYNNFTAQASYEIATNYQATSFALGYRF